MINLAVFSVKDIFKFMFKVAVVISICMIVYKTIIAISKYDFGKFISNMSFANSMKSEISITDFDVGDNEKKYSILEQEIGLLEITNNVTNMSIAKNNSVQDIEYKESNIPEKQLNKNEQVTNNKVKTEVVEENNLPVRATDNFEAVAIKNESDYDLTDDILTPNFMPENKKDIIIFHTHTCESYTPTKENDYVESGNYRTCDLEHSVARVGDELERRMQEKRL